MKNNLLLLLLISPFFIFAQLQNGDFSDWEIVDGIEKPSSWLSNQNVYSNNITRITEGTNSWIKFTPAETYDCGGVISQTISISSLTSEVQLTFDIRAKSLEADSSTLTEILISHFTKELEITGVEYFKIDTIIEDFTNISFPLDNSLLSDSIKIHIQAASKIGPFDNCINLSEIELDNIQLSVTTSQDHINSSIRIHPIPAVDFMFIEGLSDKKTNIKIFDINGKLVLDRIYNTGIEISSLPPGMYFLIVEGTTHKVLVGR